MPKHLEWTPRLVTRFWDGFAQAATLDAMSFAKLAGPVLMEFMSPWIAQGARCLDYGGGSGHLLTLMVKAGYRSAIFEPSIHRAAKVSASMAGELGFLGTVSTHDRETFDFVICTEVIEHIAKADTENFGRTMTRRIAPGGFLFLTTPFAEDLAEGEVYCPSCDHFFHRWQHQRSWQIADIEGLMKRWGLTTEWLGRVGFDDPHCVRDFHLRRRCGERWPWFAGDETPLIGRADHIVYIGRKPSEAPVVPNDLERLTSVGLAKLGANGAAPSVVGQSFLDQGDAPIGIMENDLVSEAGCETIRVEGSSATYAVVESLPVTAPQGTIVVFPGSLAPDNGGSLQPSAALVFEGRWRPALPVNGHLTEAGNVVPDRRRGVSLIGRTKPRLLQKMRENLRARRLQPWLDRREGDILPTLLSPGAFPYRLSYAVEGRVLLGISTLGSGGAERQMVNTAQGLRARGVDDVHFLVEYLHDRLENAFYLDKAAKVAAGVHTPPDEIHGTATWTSQHPQFKEALTGGLFNRILNAASVIKKLAPEIVQTSLDWTNITVGIAAVLAGVPKVFISGRNLAPTHFEFFQWFMYPCYRALAQHPNVQILNNSDAGRHSYAKWLKLAPERITVLRNGLATDEFPVVDDVERQAARSKLGIADDTPVVAGIFRLSAEKRPLLWIETAAKIKARMPDTVFLLCGIGPMDLEIRSTAAALGLGDSIQYLGVRSDIQTVFSATDLVLQTALQEGTPNALIEAQATGISVVTTPAFGAAEAVDHGATGLVVGDETAAGLADASVSILEDQQFRAAVRHTGPSFIDARFGFDRMVNDTLSVYADAGVSWALDCLPERLRHRAYVPLQTMMQDRGYAWTAHLPQFEVSGDNAENPKRSRLMILEDGRALGPAHTAHDIIRSEGGGAFSHWNGNLYFSTSDHTDPTTNGREYVAMIPR